MDKFHYAHKVTDINEMLDSLASYMYRNQLEKCFVIVVFANADDKYVKENICELIPYWHFRSEKHVSFVFLGYEPDECRREVAAHESEQEKPVEFNLQRKFRTEKFVEAINSFEKNVNWKYSGQASVVICKCKLDPIPETDHDFVQVRSRILSSSVIEFDLEKAQKENLIESPKVFF